MSSVSIIGTGNMATAIGDIFTAAGATVQSINRSETPETVTGAVVVLAVPYTAVEGVLGQYAEQLAGKTVIDITNPLDFETFDSLTVPAGSSAAEIIAAKLPHSHVLKAFNTTFAGTLTAKSIGALRTTVLIAGDNSEAKASLAASIGAAGINALDAGSLARAHELEAIGFLQLTLAAGEKISWTGGFGTIH